MISAFLGATPIIRVEAPITEGAGPALLYVDRTVELALLPPAPLAGIIIGGCVGAADIQRFGAALAVIEARAGLDDGSLRIVAEIASGAGLLAMSSLPGCSQRLDAIGWNGEAFARGVGARFARTADGAWIAPCATARSLTLAAASAAGVAAVDSPFSGLDAAAFRLEAEEARRDGFTAKFANSAEQARVLKDVFGG
jgi:citrate lyase subunit beta/citryl-CoA lyase